MAHRVALLLLAEDLVRLEAGSPVRPELVDPVDRHLVRHRRLTPRPGGAPAIASRTHACSSQLACRNATRSADAGPWPGDDRPQLVPVGLRVAPLAGGLVEAQRRVGQRQAELADPGHVDAEELLAQLLGRLGLDPPEQVAVLLARRARAVHLHQRRPPAVERLLEHRPLVRGAGREGHDDVAAVHDVDRLLPADLAHGPRVRRVARVAQRLLGDDRRGVHEPRDDADVRPGPGRVVEDVVELRLPGEQVLDHRLARLAEVLGDPVQELRVTDLVLDLGRQGELPAQRRRAQDPVALGEDAHQLGVGVHLDEPEHGAPVLVGHPVGRLDLAAGLDVGDERVGAGVVRQRVVVEREGAPLGGRQDGCERERVGHAGSPESERSDRSA